MRIVTALAVTAVFCNFAEEASAEGKSGVERIRETGIITIGHPETSIPFAFLDGNQKPAGYTVEICQAVAEKIKESLKLEKLDVHYNPVTSSTRIPLMENGTIDLECGNTTNKTERHEFVSFAPTTFVAQIVLTARKDTAGVDVNDISSFKGKTIAAQAGGQNFKVVSELNSKGNLGITVVGASDVGQTFLMMESGRAAASANDDGLAYAAVASSKTPDAFVVGTKGLEVAPYGIMQPKNDPEFKKIVDTAVIEIMTSGKLEELYQKYFMSPVPPRNINLNYPMSDALKRAIANPTDSGEPADYM